MNIGQLLLPFDGITPNVVRDEMYERLMSGIRRKFFAREPFELRELFSVSRKEIIMGEFPEGLAKALQSFQFPQRDTMVLSFCFHSQACAIELPWSVLLERIDAVWEVETDMLFAPSSLEWLIDVDHEYYVTLFRPRMEINRSTKRWNACAASYRDTASNHAGYGHLMNMVTLIERLKVGGDLSALRPLKSMDTLTVSKIDHWDPEARFFSIGAYPDGTFQIQCFKGIARPSGKEMRRSFEETIETFWQLAEAL